MIHMTRAEQPQLLGGSSQVLALRREIATVAASEAKVLITGESGVGKELVARSIHAQSHRAVKPFIAMNCAGLSDTLLETELFGHVKGSFTGAYRDKAGKLALGHLGTIFLDEIGEMTLRMQGLLLRFLETGELEKVGSDRENVTVNVRVVAATNRDLRQLIVRGDFREDLFYRLNVIHLVVPPLRERRVDIPVLIEHFFERASRQSSRPLRKIEPDAMTALMEYSWPGNVRELQNVVERLVIRTEGDTVTVRDLPYEVQHQVEVSARRSLERRRTVADDLYEKLREERQSFWVVVYPLYMRRDITSENLRELVRKGLQEARGDYRIVAKLFNVQPEDYKKFLSFLRQHECDLPLREFRR
jgi:transcriptional regulator with PAS, ATPase and Fis domain